MGDEDAGLKAAAERWFLGMAGAKSVREQIEGVPGAARRAWQRFTEFGVGGLLPEIGSRGEAARLFASLGEQAGRALYIGPLAEGCAAALAGAPRLADEERLFIPALQESDALPSTDPPETTLLASEGAFALLGAKRAVPYADIADGFLISARRGDETVLVPLARAARGLEIVPAAQVDGSVVATLRLDRCPILSGEVVSAKAIGNIVELLLVSTSARLIGTAARTAETTRDYLMTRKQFGRELAAFQVLQHRCADHHIEIRLAKALLSGVTASWEDESRRLALLHALKAFAAQTALKVAKDAIQLHGAIGFTHEHDAGLYLRHAMVLAARYGDAASHRRSFAAAQLDLFL